MKLYHPDDPKNTISANEDHAQAYLQSGWLEKKSAAEDKDDDDK